MKILVIDDEVDIQYLFEQKFRKEIRNNEVAVKYMDIHNHEVILILTDINMPGMSGLELLKYFKEHYIDPSPKVILITAYSDDENYNLAMKHGAEDFLTKPIDFNHLKKKLKTIFI
jgi:CheY-like chemotaxis protein